MEPHLDAKIRTDQRLCLSFALQQSLKILQMPQLDLSEWLMNEAEKNPFLQIVQFPKKGLPEIEIEAPMNVHEHIKSQIRDHFGCSYQRKKALEIFSHLDEKGFLSEPIPDDPILKTLQTLDPPGIFARNLQESLLIQLKIKGKEKSLSYEIISEHYEDFLHRRFSKIKKSLKIKQLDSILEEISHLTLRPLENFQKKPAPPISLDLILERDEDRWHLELVEDDLPLLKMEQKYLDLQEEHKEQREVLQTFKTRAKAIFRSLEQRRSLLYKMGLLILEKQGDFLDQKGPFQSLSLKTVAQSLKVHESTLSRALFGKYIATPRGIFPLKALFVEDTLSMNTQELLQRILQDEDKNKPLTDEQISQALQAQGIYIARRTIAKYRSKLNMGSASQRKLQ